MAAAHKQGDAASNHACNGASPGLLLQACGSGGTTAGIALGNHLSGLGLRVHAYGVCDDPAYFYGFCDGLLAGLGATPEVVGSNAAGMFR